MNGTGAAARGVGMSALRKRVTLSLSVMFVITMLAAGPFIDWPFGRDGWVGRLIALSLALPAIMLVLGRLVLAEAGRLEHGWAEMRELYERARLDSLIDPLTGLGNHRAFQEEFARQVELARREGATLSLVLIDLDELKRVNDELGHAGGDGLLAEMGHVLASGARRGDRAFRVGGDEFAILMAGTNLDAAALAAKRLLAAALEGGHAHDGRRFSFSAGVSSFPAPSTSGARLFRHADAALYWCKRHGRTDVQPYDAARHGQSGDERNADELAAAVGTVATRKSLTPLYQPIYSLATGQVIGHEALVRPAAGSGFHDAESLFTAAEATGRTVELDAACLEVVAIAAGAIPANRYLAVNLSPRTLESDEFSPARFAATFEQRGISPATLVIELTERDVVEDIERLRRNLDACRSMGIRVAADDVGSGNAGLRLLSEITFDLVKIDLSLVQSGVLRQSSMAVIQALRDLAVRSEATIVAEGIETAHQLEVVRDLGLAAGQGYLLGRPQRSLVTDPLDIAALIESDHQRRREVLGTASEAA